MLSSKETVDQVHVPHLTQDTTWESNKNTINITNKSQKVSPLTAGDHKAAINRRESIRRTSSHILYLCADKRIWHFKIDEYDQFIPS